MRCSRCGDSCGNDYKTRTKYKEEKNAGDCIKVILLQIFDLVFVHNFQVSEVKALIDNTIKEHIIEEDEFEVKSKSNKKKRIK